MSKKLVIYTDGASRGNPGPAAYGVYIIDEDQNTTELKGALGDQTNNFAEYTAVVEAIKWMVANSFKEAELRADSELMIKQINGEYKVKSDTLKPLHAEIKSLMVKNQLRVNFKHVRREFNKDADRLANEALDY